MSDREVVIAAILAAIAAFVARPVPWWAVVLAVVAALAARRPWLVLVAVALVASARAGVALDGLAERPGRVESSMATVLSDPVSRFGRWQFDVDRDGGHEAADLSRDEPAPVVGERLVVSGTTSPMPDSDWRRARHLRARLRIDAVSDRSPPTLPLRLADVARDRLVAGASSIGQRLPLFRGLVLGDDRDQDALTRSRFRTSGLAHLLAVSGQNVAFVLVAVSPLLRLGSLRWRWIATLLALGGFTLVTRWEPSVLRAVVMAAVAATAHLQGRYASGARRVAVAVVVLLLADPMLVWSTGFRLSVAATAALVALQRPIERRLPGPRWLASPLATVLAAQIGTTPLLVAMGATVTPASVPANLLAVPVAGWVMVWGLTGGVVAAVAGGPLGWLVHRPTTAMLWWIDQVAAAASSPHLPVLGTVASLVGLMGVVAVAVGPSRRWRWLGAAAVVAVGVAGLAPPPDGTWVPTAGLHVWRTGGVTAVVAGGQVDPAGLLDQLRRLRIRTVDLAVITSDSSAGTTLGATLQDAAEVGHVVAPPGRVRGAADLVAGPIRVGGLRLEVRRESGRWVVDRPRVG